MPIAQSDPIGPPSTSRGAAPDGTATYAALMRVALALARGPGLGLGVLLVAVFGLGLRLAAPWPPLAQGHGQVQLLGFVLLFALAVGLQLLPRFLAAPIARPERVLAGGALVAGAV